MQNPPYRDRRDAGRVVAKHLKEYAGRPDVIVLALPRGGVPVAYEIAEELQAPLDVFLVRKLGMPGHEELAIGAIATGGVRVLAQQVVRSYDIDERTLDAVARREEQELARREREYRGDRPPPDLTGRTAILVDDGLATGASMRAAITALRTHDPAHVVVAVPVASPETCKDFEDEVDEIVCAVTADPLLAVGAWYDDFSQTTDEEVQHLLRLARERERSQGSAP